VNARDVSLFPEITLPTARQYRHCGLLRYVSDDTDAKQFRSLAARNAMKHQIVDLKRSFGGAVSSSLNQNQAA